MRLVVATTNPNKVREIRALLEGLDLELVGLERWPDVEAAEETGATFAENARLKARHYAAATGELVVAEDSGLCVDALGGAPGVESARFGGVDATYPQKFERLYAAFARADDASRRESGGPADRAARFVCALALARGRDILFEARGIVEGVIAPAPKGAGGFGYDPIFFYPPFGKTLGEATPDEKAAVSHRGQAFRQLRAFLGKATAETAETAEND